MAQIYRLASHLIYWRKAKLIDQIRVSNVYVVAPQAAVNEYGILNCLLVSNREILNSINALLTILSVA